MFKKILKYVGIITLLGGTNTFSYYKGVDNAIEAYTNDTELIKKFIKANDKISDILKTK